MRITATVIIVVRFSVIFYVISFISFLSVVKSILIKIESFYCIN
jgi:hypothetical protein